MQRVLPSINKLKLRGSWTRLSEPDRSATARLTFSRHLCGRSKRVAKINIRKIQISGGGNEVWIGLRNGQFCQQRDAESGWRVREFNLQENWLRHGWTGAHLSTWQKSCSRALTANCRDGSYTTSEFSCTFRLLSSQVTSEIYSLEFERQHLCLQSTAALMAKHTNTKLTASRRHWWRNKHLKYAQILCIKWIYPLVTPCKAL